MPSRVVRAPRAVPSLPRSMGNRADVSGDSRSPIEERPRTCGGTVRITARPLSVRTPRRPVRRIARMRMPSRERINHARRWTNLARSTLVAMVAGRWETVRDAMCRVQRLATLSRDVSMTERQGRDAVDAAHPNGLPDRSRVVCHLLGARPTWGIGRHDPGATSAALTVARRKPRF